QAIRQLLGQALGDPARQLPQSLQFPFGERPAKGEDLFEQGDRRPDRVGVEMLEDRRPATRGRLAEHLLADLLAEEPVDIVDPFPRRRRGGRGPAPPREIVPGSSALAGAGAVELIESRRGALPLRTLAALHAQDQSPTLGQREFSRWLADTNRHGMGTGLPG